MRLGAIFGLKFLAFVTAGLSIVWNTATLSLAVVRPDIVERLRTNLPEAKVAIARSSLANGRDGDAIRAAASALRGSPVATGALGILARAKLNLTDRGGATRLTHLLPQIGLRDPLANLAALQLAAEAKNTSEMIRLADIVLRTDASDSEAVTVGITQEAEDPAFAKAFARRIAGMPQWRTRFLEQIAARNASVDGGFGILRELRATQKPPTEAELAPYFLAHYRGLPVKEAFARWSLFFPGKVPKGKVENVDGQFESAAGVPPFDWYLPKGEVVSSTIASDPATGQGSVLVAEFSGQEAGLAALQVALLPSGRHRISFEASTRKTDDMPRLLLLVSCVETGASLARQTVTVSGDWHRFTSTFVVPASGCQGQRMEFWIEPSALHANATVVIDNVSVQAEGLGVRQ